MISQVTQKPSFQIAIFLCKRTKEAEMVCNTVPHTVEATQAQANQMKTFEGKSPVRQLFIRKGVQAISGRGRQVSKLQS